MGRPSSSSCCYKQKLRKGLWSPDEDEKLLRHITKFGHGCWSSIPKQAGLLRCGKSCRLRWINYLRPDLKRGTFSEDEENLIIHLHKALGNRWSQIAAQLPGRTDNEIKNLWNSCLKKKLKLRGIDPLTHKPLSDDKNGDDSTTVDSVSMVYKNELNHLNVRNILSQRQSLVSSKEENSKGASFNGSNRSFFTDRYENSQYANCITSYSDLLGLNQWSYGTHPNPNQNLGFTQLNGKTYSSNMSTVFPDTSMAANTSSSTTFQAQTSLNSSSFDMNRFWEMGCSNNSGSSSNSTTASAELQDTNNGVYSIFIDTIQEDIKWPELLRNPFFMAAALQNETPQQAPYNEIKSDNHNNTHSASIWSHNQQIQQSSQAEFARWLSGTCTKQTSPEISS